VLLHTCCSTERTRAPCRHCLATVTFQLRKSIHTSPTATCAPHTTIITRARVPPTATNQRAIEPNECFLRASPPPKRSGNSSPLSTTCHSLIAKLVPRAAKKRRRVIRLTTTAYGSEMEKLSTCA